MKLHSSQPSIFLEYRVRSVVAGVGRRTWPASPHEKGNVAGLTLFTAQTTAFIHTRRRQERKPQRPPARSLPCKPHPRRGRCRKTFPALQQTGAHAARGVRRESGAFELNG